MFNLLIIFLGGIFGLLFNGVSFFDDVNINWCDEVGIMNKILI